MALSFFFIPFATIPVARIITGIIINLMLLIRFILFFFFYPSRVSFLTADIATPIIMQVFPFFNYYTWPIYRDFFICVYPSSP